MCIVLKASFKTNETLSRVKKIRKPQKGCLIDKTYLMY